MTIRLGQGAYVGMGVKTPYATNGTNADITQYFQVKGGFDNLQLERDVLDFEDLTNQWMHTTLLAAGQRRVTGSLTLVCFYDQLQDVLRMLTGHNVSPTGTGPYSYAFGPPTKSDTSHYWAGTTKRHLVIEVYRGGSVANSVFYQGCEISSIRFDFNPNAFVEMQLTFIGRGYTIGAKSTTPTYPVDPMFTPTGQNQSTDTTFELGGVTYPVRGPLSCTISNNIDFNFDLTGIETDIPLPTGKDTATMEAEIEVGDDTLLDILDDPVGSHFGNATIQLEKQSNLSKITINFARAVLKAPAESRPQGHGVQTARVSVEAYTTVLTASYTITLVNGDSAYIG